MVDFFAFSEFWWVPLVVLDIERITRTTTNTVVEVVHLIDRANRYRIRYTVPYRPDVPWANARLIPIELIFKGGERGYWLRSDISRRKSFNRLAAKV